MGNKTNKGAAHRHQRRARGTRRRAALRAALLLRELNCENKMCENEQRRCASPPTASSRHSPPCCPPRCAAWPLAAAWPSSPSTRSRIAWSRCVAISSLKESQAARLFLRLACPVFFLFLFSPAGSGGTDLHASDQPTNQQPADQAKPTNKTGTTAHPKRPPSALPLAWGPTLPMAEGAAAGAGAAGRGCSPTGRQRRCPLAATGARWPSEPSSLFSLLASLSSPLILVAFDPRPRSTRVSPRHNKTRWPNNPSHSCGL